MELTGYKIMFLILSAVIIVFSILTVTSHRILRAATFLLFVLIATSGLYFMLHYEFLAAVQLTLYAGGIVVLIIFSILLTSHIDQRFEPITLKKKIYGAIAAVAGILICVTTILNYKFDANLEAAQQLNMNVIGKSLLSYERNGFVLPFEVISILLLAAMIAAIVIAKKKNINENN